MRIRMVGKLKKVVASEKFPIQEYELKSYPSGFEVKRLKFNISCGTNQHLLNIDGTNGKIYSMTRKTKDKDSESIQIEFEKRFNVDVDTIAKYKLFVVDLEEDIQMRAMLSKIVNADTCTDEDLQKVNCTSFDEVQKKLDISLAKKHEFVSTWDFVDCVKELLNLEEYKDRLFDISGEVKYSYSKDKNEVYKNYMVTSIRLAGKDTQPMSKGMIDEFYYSPKASIDKDRQDNGYVYINGWERTYLKADGLIDDGKRNQKPIKVEICMPVDEVKKIGKDGSEIDTLDLLFSEDIESPREIYVRGIVFDILNGSQKVEFTEENLSDKEKKLINAGYTTFENIAKDKIVYGDTVRLYQFAGIPKRGSHVIEQETDYTLEDMNFNKYLIKNNTSASDDEIDDLFSDDFDDDLDDITI